MVLPSALNLPQTNPSTTLEYAPVPPEDDDIPPPVGNFDQFGLGNSSSIDTGGAAGGDGSDPRTTDQGKNTGTKRCVQTAKGPKQTEDPLAPPCVPDYPKCNENGGATYQGVTAERDPHPLLLRLAASSTSAPAAATSPARRTSTTT